MIDSFVLVSSSKEVERIYGVKNFYPELKIPVPRILSTGDEFWALTYCAPQKTTLMRFGYTSEYSTEFENLLNIFISDPYEYFTKSRITSKHYPKRCLVIVDAFFVKSSKNEKYLVHLQNKQRAVGLAAMFGYWINNNTGMPYIGFSIFTVHSSPLFQKVGINELPVILTPETAHCWIGEDFRSKEVISLFKTNNDGVLNGYPVGSDIPQGPVTWDQLQPIGERLKPIEQNTNSQTLKVLMNENQTKDSVIHRKNNIIYLR